MKQMIKSGNDFVSFDGKNNCDSILSCLVITFEHELVHGLQDCFCQKWMRTNKGPSDWTGKAGPGSAHSKTFMSILNNTFGHTDYRHKLFSEEKKKKSKKKESKTKKLTKLGEDWQKAAEEDIIEREKDSKSD
jgi:hypothetical protein